MNPLMRKRKLLIVCFILLMSFSAVSGVEDSLKVTLTNELIETSSSIRQILSETRKDIARIEAFKSEFLKEMNALTNHVHEFRYNLTQRKKFLSQMHRSLISHNSGDTLKYNIDYWHDFSNQLNEELSSEKWSIDYDAYPGMKTRLDYFSRRLNHDGVKMRLMKDAVSGVLELTITKPLEPELMLNVQNGVGSLRDALAGSEYEPGVLNTIKSNILILSSAVEKLEGALQFIETALLNLKSQLNQIDNVLSRRLNKLDQILNSFQVIEANVHSIEGFNPTEVRQQLIFLRNQNQFIDYEHRVLKSFNNSIEDAIAGKNWTQILNVIAAQDPDFRNINIKDEAVVLFIGAEEINRHFLLHEERGFTSRYLYDIDSFTAIWLEDNTKESYEIDMDIELLQSEFEQTFGQFKTIWEARKRGDDIEPEPTLYFYGMKKITNISSPAKINLSMRRMLMEKNEREGGFERVEEINDVFQSSYVIHEKSYLHISVGLGAGFVKKSNFMLEGNALKVSESADRELDQHLYALLNFHLGARDVDRFDQYPFLTLQKFMIQAGIGVSKYPLDRIYLGLGYRFLKDVQLDLLAFWVRETDRDQVVSVSNAASVQDAKAMFDKCYGRGNIAIGLSFYPKKIFGLLGL